MIQFKKREIVFIFFMLVMVTTVIFGLGLFLGHEHNKLLLKPIDVAEVDQLITDVEKDLEETEKTAGVEEVQNAPELVEEPPVEVVEVPEPKEVEPEPRALTGYTIQVDIMDEREVAELEMQRIQKIGFPSVYVRKSAMGNRTWYVVDLGYFKDLAGARRFAEKVQNRGIITSYIIRKTDLNPSEFKKQLPEKQSPKKQSNDKADNKTSG